MFAGIYSTVKANEFDDGITWSTNNTNQRPNEVGNIPIGNNLSLGYALGLAQDANGNVTTGGDWDVGKPSTGDGGSNTRFSKINVFLKNGTKYIPSTYQAGYHSTGGPGETVSPTSPDFMIVPNKDTNNINVKNYSLLLNMNNKGYSTGTDSNNHPAYRVFGNLIQKNSSTEQDPLRVEVVLRPSPSGLPVIQRELYLKNNNSHAQSYGVLFAEDTKLSANDRIPLYDLGHGEGFYMSDNDYQLVVSNTLKDGFTSYTGQSFGSNWVSRFSPDNFSGQGDERFGYNYGDPLYNMQDSSYTLKWPYDTIQPGEIKHYSSAIGVIKQTYAMLETKKNFENETSTDGKNRVGDKLRFNLKMSNNGYGSKWNYKSLSDKLPAGLQLDPNSVKMETPTSGLVNVDSTYENSTLTVPTNYTITDGKDVIVTFEATITPDATSSTITNTGSFTGIDMNIPNATDKTYTASVDIPVEKSNFDYTFTKQVRNITKGETTYSNKTNADIGDEVEYLIKFAVSGNSSNYLTDGAFIHETLPTGIDGKVGEPIYTIYTDPNSNGQTSFTATNPRHFDAWIDKILPGQNLTIKFPATVNSAASNPTSNIATMTGGATSSGTEINDISTNNADLSVKTSSDGFEKVPQAIEFGQTNFAGKIQTLTNIATIGELKTKRNDSNKYSVSVAYDNDNPDTQMHNSNGDTLTPTADGLMFLKVRNNPSTNDGIWTRITSDGISISPNSFTNDEDLTSYIGAGSWKLNLNSDTKPGKYTGTLTWTMSDVMTS